MDGVGGGCVVGGCGGLFVRLMMMMVTHEDRKDRENELEGK